MPSKSLARCRLAWIASALVFSQLVAAPAFADYRLGSGDILELDVFGMPDFKRRVTVNIDGDVSVPFIGELHARDLSLSELRKLMIQQLAETGSIRNAQVTIELVEHRPFFVSGNVSKPGAFAYQPGLTVRQAAALAGGYDSVRVGSINPLLVTPDLKSENNSLWTDLVRSVSRLESLKAEMAERSEVDLGILEKAPVSKSMIKEISGLEVRKLQTRLIDFRNEQQFLSQTALSAKTRVAGLEIALQQQLSSVAEQETVVERTLSNLSKGMTASTRVDEERRGLAYLRSQQADISGRLAAAQREYSEAVRGVEKFKDARQEQLLQGIQDATVETQRLRNQIRATEDKLLYVGATEAQLRRGEIRLELIIHRRTEEGLQQLTAMEDTEIEPGDVLDVLVRPDDLLAAPSQ